MKFWLKILTVSFLLCSCTAQVEATSKKKEVVHRTEEGKASWYSVKTNGGTRTASGAKLSNNALTAAHRSLPFGTMVKVTNLSNGKSANCKITDRGPFVRSRIIDVTVGTAEQLGFKNKGVTKVKVEVIKK